MDRRRFISGSLSAAIAASLSGRQAFGSIFAALTQVSADVQATTGNGGEVTLSMSEVQELSDALRGPMLLPGNEAYEEARRVLNASINRYPALIVQPSGVADISSAVQFARDHELLVAVKCGGHSHSGKSTCDGGMLIDLSRFRNVTVDVDKRIAHVNGGSLLGELDHESCAFDLVTTAGTVSHTGVGGLTTGGGFGRVGRRFGLALDNVIAADVVTADGQLRHASAEQNSDLYWGIRGGGGNFGVVSTFEFQLHRMNRTVYGGDILFPLNRLRDVLTMYADYFQSAPDELYLDVAAMNPPGDTNGFAFVHVCYSGDPGGLEKAMAPIRSLGTPMHDGAKAVDYVQIQRSWDSSDPRATSSYIKAGMITAMDGKLIDAVIEGFEADPSRLTQMYFQHGGGQIGRVGAQDTAFSHRDVAADMFVNIDFPAGEELAPHRAYVKQYWSTLEPFTVGFYVNDLDEERDRPDYLNKNYGVNFEQLLQVKNKYDPTNLFRLNANVQPTG